MLYVISSQAYEQLIITKTSNAVNLDAINRDLKRVNVKMFVEKKENYYVVYSQKFSTKKSAQESLSRVKHYFPYARMIESKSKTAKSVKSKKNLFVGLAGGNASSSGSGDSSSGISYTLEAGYYFNKNIFVSLVYLDSSTEEIDMQSIYTTCNYEYNFTENFGAFSGLLFGYGTLSLTGELQSSSSSSLIFGGEIGVSYDVLEYLTLYSAVEYISLEHIIEYSSTDSITFDSTLNAQLGVRFKF
jgi:hypothetical protein